MVMFLKLLMSLSFLPLLANCAHWKGEELVEQKKYEEAIDFYSELKDEDPENENAIKGLQTSVDKYVAREISKIIRNRKAGRHSKAFTRLDELAEEWDDLATEPSSKVRSKFYREVRRAAIRLAKQSDKKVKFGHVILASKEFNEYSTLAKHPKARGIVKKQMKKIATSGQERCITMSRWIGPDDDYTGQYVKDYCSYWQKNDIQLPKTNVKGRFGKINITTKRFFLNDKKFRDFAIQTKIQKNIKTALKKTAYYSANSTDRISADLAMDARYKHDTSNIQNTVQYNEKMVVYDDGTTKTFQYPENKPAPAAVMPGEDKDVENESVTIKTFKYSATKHYEKFDYNANLSFSLDQRKYVYPITHRDEYSALKHNVTFEAAGIQPEDEKRLGENEFLFDSAEALSEKVVKRLTADWKKFNCSPLKALPKNEKIIEKVLRCAVVARDDKAVEFWFKKMFGLPYDEMRKYINYDMEPGSTKLAREENQAH